jgi:radical SAM protein with 4Fe4S-binding SPASM domain
VEIITNCNLGCLMCPRTVGLAKASSAKQRRAWYRHMPFSRFLSVMDSFHGLQTLSLHGIGEPLLHPRIFDMVEEATHRGIQVRFTTNATRLDPAKSERLIASNLHRLIVSLDGATAGTYERIRPGARFEEVIGNLRTLARLRRDSGGVSPWIEVNMVVQRLNVLEVPDLIELVREISLDSVILSPLQPPEPELAGMACDGETWVEAAKSAEVRARQLGIPIYIRGGLATRQKLPARTHQCLHPWMSAVITLDGEVMPCCNIHRSDYSMGNLFTDGFEDIWNGWRYRSFRRELRRKDTVPEPCRWCPDFR